jgi:chloramphenicol 3-O-phosphotransferase
MTLPYTDLTTIQVNGKEYIRKDYLSATGRLPYTNSHTDLNTIQVNGKEYIHKDYLSNRSQLTDTNYTIASVPIDNRGVVVIDRECIFTGDLEKCEVIGDLTRYTITTKTRKR